MKKTVISLFVFLCAVTSVFAAANLSFEKMSHDFGTIAEEKGPVTIEFVFTNTGDSPLVINKVVASCGCTTPNWTKTPILPGKNGSIKTTYNPQGRPGTFQKTISVYSNSTKEYEMLTIKGNVAPAKQSPDGNFPVKMQSVSTDTKSLSFSTVKRGEVKTMNILVQNNDEKKKFVL